MSSEPVNPFAAMAASFIAATEWDCPGGCGAKTTTDLCPACEARESANAAQQSAIAETLRTIPAAYRWAVLDSPLLPRRVAPHTAVERAALWVGAPNIVFIGTTGMGKTSLAVAMMRRRVRDLRQRAAFVHAFRLGVARIQHSAGDGEPAIVELAMRVPLLLLDDVGTERQTQTNAVPDVILERHAEGLPTWITTWLTPAQAAEKYGGGVARRIFEDSKQVRLGVPKSGGEP